MIRVRGSGKCCNRNAMRCWRRRFARHSTYVDARTCAFYRSREDGSVIVIRLPPKWFCYPFFCRRFESKTRVGYGMMVARSRKSIDFFLLLPSPPLFFFFWKWNLKFLRLIKTFHQIFQISQSKGYFSHYEFVSRSRDELAPLDSDECKWFRAREP